MRSRKILCLLLSVMMLSALFCLPASAAKAVKVTSVTVSKTSVTLTVGDTYTIKAKVSPSSASNKKLTYTSSAPDVAKVSKSGRVSALKEGKATVTVKAADGSGKKASVKITVTEKKAAETGGSFNRDMTAQQIVTDMQNGINIGNSLDAFSGNDIADAGLSSETCWGNPKVSKQLIDALKKKGFRTVRIPVTWHNHMDKDFNISSAWMARVKEVVDIAIDNDMYVIINMHHDCSFYDIKTALKSARDYNAIEKRFVKAWSQIGKTFADYDEHLIFEAMNEPRIEGSGAEWMGGTAEERKIVNRLNAAFVKEIRSQGGNNPYRFLMIPDYAASSSDAALNDMEFPVDDRLIFSVHAYNPYNFAMNNDASGTFTDADKAALDQFFAVLSDRFISRGIPVVIGEMGAINKNNPSDRRAWAEYYVKKARSYGITCLWWDNGYSEPGGDGFAIINRFNNKYVYEDIADALIKNSA